MSEKILDFVKHHCPASDIVGIMLTGSYADHTESRYSDVDIIVVSMLASRQTHENIIEDGTMYQLIIFPYCKIATLIFDDITSTRTVFFRMFKKGIILFDSKGLLKKLQNIFCGQEDSINSEIDILRLRRRITNEIEYILGSDETNKMHSVLEVVRQTSQLIVGKQSLTGKHLDRAISLYKNEQSLLQNALSAYFINNNGKEFVNTIQALLKPFGGFLEKYTTGYVFNVPHDKQMLVFMPVCSMKSEATRNMIETIRKLCKPPFYYVVFYEGQNQMMEQGIYLFVYSETASITSFCRLLDKLRVPKGIYMSYPYQSSFYEGVYFGGMSTFRYLLPLFSRISTLYMDICQNKQAEHLIYQRTIAVKILYYYIYFSFKDAQRRKLLLLECVHFFLPDAVDTNGLYNLNQLSHVKEEVLRLHNEMYDSNRDNLHDLLKDEDSTSIQIKTIIADICKINDNGIASNEIGNRILYTTSEYALHIHIISHLLSIYQLQPSEKFSLSYYLLKLSTEHVIW